MKTNITQKMPARANNRNILHLTLFVLILTLILFSKESSANKSSRYNDVCMPDNLTVFHEKIPLDKQFFYEMLERELIISVCDRAQVFMWIKRSGRYFPYIEKELKKRNMPDDIKYLAVAESALLTHAQSKAGAVGPWQFMKHTARENGLRKDRMADERRSFEPSTQAALKHLTRLHAMFNSWTLAAAAYNCGESRLKKSIEQQKVNDYFRLNLPLETERYIFRIAAVKLILENPEKYGFNVSSDRIYEPIKCDSIKINIKTPLHITAVAQKIGLDYKDIKELNPQFMGYYLPRGNHSLKVPPGFGDKLKAAVKGLTQDALKRAKRSPGNIYTVKQGDTLGHISEKTGIPVRILKQLNSINGSLIKVGQKLRLSP